ncbi:double-strand break repair helicase AddA [Emcibacteraceae bacterium]|nr:double-strand break repair helicase AddA [Emcibacteraceae bacterium]MDC0081456.1 double-strand break repair helicase AddA [Emcibacteraceae bacterium]
MNLQTPEQLKASDPGTSVWVGASAGTGKTFVLANRVLRLMLAGNRPNKILCLTYTNTAAAEMSNRVNERLANWISLADKELNSELSYVLGTAPSEDQKVAARKLFAEVLDIPGGLKIQTIHSFCQSLLGRFPIEAAISPNFDLLDEITINEHLRHSQDEMLLDIDGGKNLPLYEALNYLSGMLAEETFTELMKKLSKERGGIEQLFKQNSSSFMVVSKNLKNLLGFSSDDCTKTILDAAVDENNFNSTSLKIASETLLKGTKTDIDRGKVILGWLKDVEKRLESFDSYINVYLKKDREPRVLQMTKNLGLEYPNDYDVLSEEADRVKIVCDRLRAYALYENTLAILRIGYELIKRYNKRKINRNVVDFDDLISKVSGLFHNVSASWILFKLDEGLDHILIDEAQDTNPLQWGIIRKLSQEFFAGFGTRGEDELLENPRTIFAVGDIKQSIYSFQKAEPKKFDENKEYFIKQANDAKLKFLAVPMNLSFRSTSSILEVVDAVFDTDEHRRAISFDNAEIKHATHRKGDPGLVEVWDPILFDHEKEESDWSVPIIQKPVQNPKSKLSERIADQIAWWIKSEEILASKGRPIRAGDILILVQKRNEFVHYIIKALKKRGINVAGLDQMVLMDQLAIMDLVAIANFTLLPSDDLTLAVVLKSPFIGMSEEDLFDLANSRERTKTLWNSIFSRRAERPSYQVAVDYLTKLTNYADFHPPFEFFNYLLGPLRGKEKLIARLGEQVNDPIDEFLNQSIKYEQNNISSMQGFLSWIERGDIKIKRDMEQGADMVRVMTVHGAKGLQAPIVFLPDTCQTITMNDKVFWLEEKRNRNLLWVKNKETRIGVGSNAYEERLSAIKDENKRLLYVAMTRAEDRLYVCGWENKKSRKNDCWYDLIRSPFSKMDGTEEMLDGVNSFLRRETGEKIIFNKMPFQSGELKSGSNLPTWAFDNPSLEPIPSKPLSPSRENYEEEVVRSPLKIKPKMKLDRQKYHRGLLIHKLLEVLPEREVVIRDELARQYLRQDVHELSEHDVEIILEEVFAILDSKYLKELFGPGSRSEVPMVGQVDGFSLSGQVDRMVVSDNEVLIIDYKTNRPPPRGVENIPRIYVKQMAAYRAVIKEIYPEHNVKTYLLWTDVTRLMEIPEEMLNKIQF